MASRILLLLRGSKMVRHQALADEICKMVENSRAGTTTIIYCHTVIYKLKKFFVSVFHMYGLASTQPFE